MAGQQRAKANEMKLGRPSKMNDGMRSAVKLLRKKGMGAKQIARELQIGMGMGTGSCSTINAILFNIIDGMFANYPSENGIVGSINFEWNGKF